MQLTACVKTSGSKGMQVYVPVNGPTSYEATRAFSLGVAQLLERVHGDRVVITQTKKQRAGRVLIDWSQNHLTKSTVCVYWLRARQRPTVSTPLAWDEVEAGHTGRDPGAFHFESADVLARVDVDGDLFAPLLEVSQDLPALA